MIITNLNDGTVIERDKGSFDDYCVYVTRPNEKRYAPRDTEYFCFFIEKAKHYSPQKIYEDYVSIYNKTSSIINQSVIDEIKNNICYNYEQKDQLEFALWYIVIYLGMVAEENKRYAVLKKRIKRLGMYQILFDGMTAYEAANFSRGRKVAELDPLCREKGF